MLHVFISYNRGDAQKCVSLAEYLEKRANLKCWYDTRDIEIGKDWFDEINHNLEQAFAVIVIVTPKSLDSPYVTYEWSWALGHGLEVIPIQFGKLRKKDRTHPLLILKEVKSWDNQTTRKSTVDVLVRHQHESPLVRYVNMSVRNIVIPLRLFARIGLWSYQYERVGKIDFKLFKLLIEKAEDEAWAVYSEKLPKFWLSSAHGFTSKQKRKYDELADNVYDFAKELQNLNDVVSIAESIQNVDISQDILRAEQCRIKILEPTVSFFDVDDFGWLAAKVFFDQLPSIGETHTGSIDDLHTLEFSESALSWFLTKEDTETILKIYKTIFSV